MYKNSQWPIMTHLHGALEWEIFSGHVWWHWRVRRLQKLHGKSIAHPVFESSRRLRAVEQNIRKPPPMILNDLEAVEKKWIYESTAWQPYQLDGCNLLVPSKRTPELMEFSALVILNNSTMRIIFRHTSFDFPPGSPSVPWLWWSKMLWDSRG